MVKIKKKRVTIYMTPNAHLRAKAKALKQGLPFSQWAEQTMEKSVGGTVSFPRIE